MDDNNSNNNYTVSLTPWFGTQPGRYEYIYNVYSPQLNNVRDLVVYLPPSYDEQPYKMFNSATDVLLMHDGQNLFNVSTSSFGVAWMAQNTADAMAIDGNGREVIIIGINNAGAMRTYEYTYSSDPTVPMQAGGASYYLGFLQQTVVPLVLARYRIKPQWITEASNNIINKYC